MPQRYDKKLKPPKTRYGDAVRTWSECQLIAVGVAFGRSDIVHINYKRTVALEDVLVGFQIFSHGSQRCVNLQVCRFAVYKIANRNIVLL